MAALDPPQAAPVNVKVPKRGWLAGRKEKVKGLLGGKGRDSSLVHRRSIAILTKGETNLKKCLGGKKK